MFLVVTQWMPLHPTADRFDGCFCSGSGPVFGVSWCCFAFALFPLAKRKSGWGICGSSLFVWLWFSLFVLIDLLISRTYVLVQCFSCLLSCKDRALVRHRPISREKIHLGERSLELSFLRGYSLVWLHCCFIWCWMRFGKERTWLTKVTGA